MAERSLSMREARGSIPRFSTFCFCNVAARLQLGTPALALHGPWHRGHAQGANTHGQLGQGHTMDSHCAARMHFEDPVPEMHVLEVVLLTGGSNHTLMSVAGQVYGCGSNTRGQLHLDNAFKDVLRLRRLPLMLRMQGGTMPRLRHMCAGWDFTLLCFSVPGGPDVVYTFGDNSHGALGRGADTRFAWLGQSVDLPGHVHRVVVGVRHVLVATTCGRLYVWGDNRHGQLGPGLERTCHYLPVEQRAVSSGPTGTAILDLAAGHTHSVVLTASGDVYIFGGSKFGQHGIEPGGAACKWRPQERLGGAALRVYAGWSHVVVRMEETQGHAGGAVWAGWGRNTFHQILGSSVSTVAPTWLSLHADQVTRHAYAYMRQVHGDVQVRCGSEHGIALWEGRVLCWGWNEHGHCGVDPVDQAVLADAHTMVFPEPGHATCIGTGYSHCMALLAPS